VKTDFCTTYGVRHPIVLAGMGMVAEPPLVAAVSEAGGLGILGTGGDPPEAIAARIAAVRAATARPFGANFLVVETAFGLFTTSEHMESVAREGVSPIVFHWDPPDPAWLARLAGRGLRTWRTVNSAADAEAAVGDGFDGLVAQGVEAGGHNRGATPLAELVPAVARVAGDRHVIAAGGIADAASARAALDLGADAVCLGTRFVACVESPAHAGWKERIVAAGADDTAITTLFGPEWPDAPMRVLRNRAVRREQGIDASPVPSGPIGTVRLGDQSYPMPPASVMLPIAETEGDLEEMCLAAGTSAAAIARVETAAEIVAAIAAGLAADA